VLDKIFSITSKNGDFAGMDPRKTVDDSAFNKDYKVFLGRFKTLAGDLSMTSPAPAKEAERIWLLMITKLQQTEAKYQGLPDIPGTTYKALSSDGYKGLVKEMDPITTALQPYMDKWAKNKKNWSFWSGDPALSVAKSFGDAVCLEKSALGGLFDGLSIPSGSYGMELWGSLSKSYAEHAAKRVGSDTKYYGFVGTGSSREESIFKQVEQPRFAEMIGAKQSFQPEVLWYACAWIGPKPDNKTLDPAETGGGLPGTWGKSTNRDAMVQLAEKKNQERADMPKNSEEFFAAPEIKKGLDKMHFKAKDMAKGSIQSKVTKFLPKHADWGAVKTDLSTQGGAIKDVIDKPASAHDYGAHIVKTQAATAAQKAAETFGNADVAKKKLGGSDAAGYAKKKVTTINNTAEFQQGRDRMRDLIWDKGKGNTVVTALTAGFKEVMKKGGGTHTEFEIVWRSEDRARPDGGKEFDYRTKAGATFTVVMDKADMVASVTSNSLTLKPNSMKGLRGRTHSAGYNRVGEAPKETGIDASHLIADEFGGSGYAEANNLVAASKTFNRKIMRKQERALAEWLNDIGAVQFKLTTNVDWNSLSEEKLMKKMVKVHKEALKGVADKEQALKDQIGAFKEKYKAKLSKNLKRVHDVRYDVIGKTVEGTALGAEKFKTGPDLWLFTEQ
jgi:hypothetical protein